MISSNTCPLCKVKRENSQKLVTSKVYGDKRNKKSFFHCLDCDVRYQFPKLSKKDEIVFSHIGYKMIQATKHNLSDNLYLTIASIPMDRVSVLSFKSTEEKKKFKKLERDVIKVYPYALLVGRLLGEYSDVLDSLESLSYFKRIGKKKKIFKSIEKQLISKYGNRVRKLTKKQGRILIRLIDRETNSTSYQIIKDFKNIFSAGFWQLTARIFRHNLKSKYNPDSGEDKLIEHIIVNLKL